MRHGFTAGADYRRQDRTEEGTGPVVERYDEHLCTRDRAAIMIHQQLLDAMAKVESGGDPLGLDTNAQRLPRGYDEYVSSGVDWREYLRDAFVPKR